MKITTPTRWGDGWGMDEDGIPFRPIDGEWVEQAPIGVVLESPRRYPKFELAIVHPEQEIDKVSAAVKGLHVWVPTFEELDQMAALFGMSRHDLKFWDPNNAYLISEGPILEWYLNNKF